MALKQKPVSKVILATPAGASSLEPTCRDPSTPPSILPKRQAVKGGREETGEFITKAKFMADGRLGSKQEVQEADAGVSVQACKEEAIVPWLLRLPAFQTSSSSSSSSSASSLITMESERLHKPDDSFEIKYERKAAEYSYEKIKCASSIHHPSIQFFPHSFLLLNSFCFSQF